MRSTWRFERAIQLVEDVIRTYPTGAPTDVLVARLARIGVGASEVQEILARLQERRLIASARGRWQMRS